MDKETIISEIELYKTLIEVAESDIVLLRDDIEDYQEEISNLEDQLAALEDEVIELPDTIQIAIDSEGDREPIEDPFYIKTGNEKYKRYPSYQVQYSLLGGITRIDYKTQNQHSADFHARRFNEQGIDYWQGFGIETTQEIELPTEDIIKPTTDDVIVFNIKPPTRLPKDSNKVAVAMIHYYPDLERNKLLVRWMAWSKKIYEDYLSGVKEPKKPRYYWFK